MLLNQLHWLDILEYVAYGLTAISFLVAIAIGSFFYPLAGVIVTLGLNIINRVRAAQASVTHRKMVTGTVKQLQRQWGEEVQPLSVKVSSTAEMTQQTLDVVQENIITLEESLNGIVQYLNNHALRERVERIERSYLHLKKDILSVFPDQAPNFREIEPPPADLPTSLPTIALTSTPSTIAIPQWKEIHQIQGHTDAIASVTISSDGKLLASASWDHTLKLWDLGTGEAINTTDAHDQAVLAVVFTADDTGYHLASGSFDHTIKLWTLTEAHLRLDQLLTSHTGSIHALNFAPTEMLVLSGSYDQSVKQWDVREGAMVASSYEALGAIYALALDPQEQFIASAGGDGTVTLWQLGTGEKIANLIGNVSSVKSLALSPDGQILGAGCVDGTIKLWQLNPKQLRSARPTPPIRTFTAHRGQVQAILFDRRGEFLLSGGADGKIKIWHPGRSEAIVTLNLSDDSARPPAIGSLAMSRDGEYLAAGGGDGMIGIWQKQ